MTTRRRIYESTAKRENRSLKTNDAPSGGEIRAMPIMRGTDKTARTLSATFEKSYEKKTQKNRTLSRLLRHCAEV